ncbi:hypothetical protein ACFLTS_07475 [Chloroflexota bacterium]
MSRVYWRYLILLSVIMTLVMVWGCGQKVAVLKAPPERPIPSDFITYTDEKGLFSIYYPSSWDTDFSTEEVKEYASQVLQSLESDTFLDEVLTLFTARKSAYPRPNIEVVINPDHIDPRGLTVDEVADEQIKIAESCKLDGIEDWRVISRTKTTIDGIDAVIVHERIKLLGITDIQYVSAYLITGPVVWDIQCGVSSDKFEEYEDTFWDIIRSFRILK